MLSGKNVISMNIINNKKNEKEIRDEYIKGKLVYNSYYKLNYLDMLTIFLGYIIVSFKGQENKKDKVYLITPILYSFDGYEAKIKKYNLFDDYFWIPIYIEKKHYKRSKEKIF